MKSFADWTQELAESVGEVRHHWEEPKVEDELYEPNWQAPGAPILGSGGAALATYPKEFCDGCSGRDGTVGKRLSTTNPMVFYHLCADCARTYGYGEIVP